MASTSSSTLPLNYTHRYDVFLSFRGEDTRHNFTDHLYRALLGEGLRTFRDNDDINRGQELKPEIEAAIIESKTSIVVLSENYANSRWCLDELCLILEQRKKLNHFVLPVFYHVDPSDVRNQRRKFAIKRSVRFSNCFACSCMEAKEGSKWTEANMRKWKDALTEVANLGGMELLGYETNFITEMVGIVKCKVDLRQLSTPAHLTGMEAQVGRINSWLKDVQYNAIAICGMGGSGKTTLAQCIYNLNKQEFESSSFIQVIGKQHDGLFELQKQLLEDLFGGKKINISSVLEGTNEIQKVLQTKRVLIVLDGIDKHEQLEALLGTKRSATHSKIIITTGHLDINAWLASISWSCRVHKIKLLNDRESLELFSLYAFRSPTPMEDFKELAVQLTRYCGGHPLALRVLGSSLVVSDENPSSRNGMIDSWRSRLNSLDSLTGNLDRNIQYVLKKSFDSLPLRKDKELFLHIACFFVGEARELVESILEDELYAKSGIMTLIHRCLLTISPNGKLIMHQLLQEMGRDIVCEESNDPGKRSRVWRDVESYRVLRKKDVPDTVEGLALDMRKVEHGMRSKTLAIETSSLANMYKLKLLQLKYVELSGSYEYFPALRWLCWHGCLLKTIPFGLLMRSLVAIDMSYGHIEMFEAPTVLNSLKYLSLKECDQLVSISNIYRLPKLESLILLGCSRLTHLCESIGKLKRLVSLDLKGCIKLLNHVNQSELVMLPLPESLEHLDLTNCDMEFNNDICVALHAKSSTSMLLAFNPFEYLPNNIDVKRLKKLNLNSCTNLKCLSCIPCTLEELYINWCTSLEKVTFQSGRFSLREFSYECCFKLFEIQGLFKLVPLAKLEKTDLGHMHWIKAYEDHKVDLVGDDITKGRIWHTQVLYEYGIMSTYLQGINDQIMTTYEYTSSSSFLSFCVPCHHENKIIQGLNVSCLYRSSISNDKDSWLLLAKISNITKGLTWIYNPVVYYKPSVDKDVVWLSYWPIGNVLDVGDIVHVEIIRETGMLIISGCSASLVYMDIEEEEDYGNNSMKAKEENYENSTTKHEEEDGENNTMKQEEENCENSSMMKEEEVIGGDLSEFMVTTGGYYLCRRDLFGSETSSWLNQLFCENVRYPASKRWRKTHQSVRSWVQKYSLNTSLRRIESGSREGHI